MTAAGVMQWAAATVCLHQQRRRRRQSGEQRRRQRQQGRWRRRKGRRWRGRRQRGRRQGLWWERPQQKGHLGEWEGKEEEEEAAKQGLEGLEEEEAEEGGEGGRSPLASVSLVAASYVTWTQQRYGHFFLSGLQVETQNLSFTLATCWTGVTKPIQLQSTPQRIRLKGRCRCSLHSLATSGCSFKYPRP